MNFFRPWRFIVPALLLAAALAGCNKQTAQVTDTQPQQGPVQSFIGGPSSPAQGAIRRGMEIQAAKGPMENIKLFVATYKTDRGRGPADLKDFVAYIQRDAPQIVKYLQEGQIAMDFRQNLPGDALRAYVGFADGAGNRLVLRENGVIEVLNTQQFEAARKK